MTRPWDAIAWWEIRRIPFNLTLLAAGFVSTVIIEVIGSRLVHPGEDVVEPMGLLFGGIAYILAANLCYTLGWVTELLWSWGNTASTEGLRAKVFLVGLVFSVLLTLLPALLVPLIWTVWGFS